MSNKSNQSRLLPAEVIGHSDRLWANLSPGQTFYLLLALMIAVIGLNWPQPGWSFAKLVWLGPAVAGCLLPAGRWQGRLIATWLVIIISYRQRPKQRRLKPARFYRIKIDRTPVKGQR